MYPGVSRGGEGMLNARKEESKNGRREIRNEFARKILEMLFNSNQINYLQKSI